MEKQRIMVADDELSIRKYIKANLKARNYDVAVASNGSEALHKIANERIDLIILDINMPDVNGFEVCRSVRDTSNIPIIMLSARDEEKDKERCFEMGADDYLTKPCSLNELLGRIRAVLRRSKKQAAAVEHDIFRYKGLKIDFNQKIVFVKNMEIKLTRTEYRIIEFLARNAGRVLAPEIILEKIWGEGYRENPDILWVNLSRLRTKLKANSKNEKYIFTKQEFGYYIKATKQTK
jgi:two-component system, OmpR family, KDP operon response regulator KdpE